MAAELQLVIPSMSRADGSDPTEGQLLQQGEVSKKTSNDVESLQIPKAEKAASAISNCHDIPVTMYNKPDKKEKYLLKKR